MSRHVMTRFWWCPSCFLHIIMHKADFWCMLVSQWRAKIMLFLQNLTINSFSFSFFSPYDAGVEICKREFIFVRVDVLSLLINMPLLKADLTRSNQAFVIRSNFIKKLFIQSFYLKVIKSFAWALTSVRVLAFYANKCLGISMRYGLEIDFTWLSYCLLSSTSTLGISVLLHKKASLVVLGTTYCMYAWWE